MRALLYFVFTVDALLLAVVVIGVWQYLRPASRAARRALLGVVVFYALVATYGLTYAAGRVLVAPFEPFQRVHADPNARTAIVVLGSGSITVRDWDGHEYSTVDIAAASRVREAVRVYNLIDADYVISSGGKVYPNNPNVATAKSMEAALLQMGIPRERLLVETTSRNTYEEALVVRDMLPPLGVTQVVLVTSDLHMLRSVGTFKAAGIPVVPAIARHPFSWIGWYQWVLPSELGLWMGAAVSHELAGIAFYGITGRFKP